MILIYFNYFIIQSCQTEIVRDNGHRYFLNVLSDPNIFYKHRTMAAFILASIVKNYRKGQVIINKQYKNDKINKIKLNIFRKLLYKEVD